MGADIYLDSVLKKHKRDLNKLKKRIETELEKPGAARALWREHGIAPQDIMWSAMRSTGGYLRNGYTVNADVMFAMGLDWHGTVLPMLDDKSYLPIAKARELLDLIAARPITKATAGAQYLKEHPVQIGFRKNPLIYPGDDEPLEIKTPPLIGYELWLQEMNARRDALIAILNKSIELNEPLCCWL
jgi:hypothetical protein